MRRALAALGILALLGCVAWIVARSRRGPDYQGPLAALVPQPAIATVRLGPLAALFDSLKQSRAFQELQSNLDFAALMLDEDDWREFIQNSDSRAVQMKLAVARAFLKRYLNDALLAVVPCPARPERPGLIAVLRTETGFLDDLAQLAATLYPDLRLTTSAYRGLTLHLYESKKKRRSFSFTRFGDVVVVSLRTPDLAYLKDVVDGYHRMRASGAPARADGAPVDRGLLLEAEMAPSALWLAWQAIYPENARSLTNAQRAFVSDRLDAFARAKVNARLGPVASIQARLEYAEARSDDMRRVFAVGRSDFPSSNTLPAQSILAVWLSHPRAPDLIAYICDLVSGWPEAPPADEKEAKRREKQRRKREKRAIEIARVLTLAGAAAGMDLAGEFDPSRLADFAAAVISVTPGLLAPQFQAQFLAISHEAASRAGAAELAAREGPGGASRAQTPLGVIEARRAPGILRLRVGDGAASQFGLVASGAAPRWIDSGEWRRLVSPAPALVYVDLRSLRAALQAVVDSSTMWDEDAREDLVRARDTVGALSVFTAAALSAHPTSDSLELRLRFLLD